MMREAVSVDMLLVSRPNHTPSRLLQPTKVPAASFSPPQPTPDALPPEAAIFS